MPGLRQISQRFARLQNVRQPRAEIGERLPPTRSSAGK
jgi:hypothetical protein